MISIQKLVKSFLKNPTQTNCKSRAKQIHALIIKCFPIFSSNLVSVYSKLNLLPESVALFNSLPSPSIVAWKSIITFYSCNAYFLDSLNCFVKMRALGIYPDHNVFPSVLKSCTHLRYMKLGESVHGSIIRVGLEFDVFTGNALLSMYSKLQRFSAREVFDGSPQIMKPYQNESILNPSNNNTDPYQVVSKKFTKVVTLNRTSDREQMQSVRKVFETMLERDVISYNMLVLGYTHGNMYNEAMMMTRELCNANLRPDTFTLSSVLPIIAKHMDVWKGKEIHGYGIRQGFERNEFIASGLINMYANCNMVEDSYRLFCSQPKKDYVLYCSIISAHVQNGLFDEGLRLFRQMLSAGIKPVQISCSSIIPVCAHLTTLPLGQQLHGCIIRNHFDDNMFIASSLVNMYAKCGNMKVAKSIFDHMKQHDLVSWTSMIMGCASHGHAHDAISLFERMEMEDFRPNSVAFVSVLTACSHAGIVNEGLRFFERMVKHYNIAPELEHYACMADLLGRAGRLEDAFRFLYSIPENKTASVWLPLLAACRVHKNVELAEKVAMQIYKFDSENMGAYVLLSNTYSCVGRYKDSGKVRRMLTEKVNRKEPACSWITIGSKVHSFIAGSESHSNYDVIINALDVLFEQLEKEEYVADDTMVW